MKTVALVFGRKNSKGLKNKNIRKINGKSAFSHVIDETKKVKTIKKIFVSTDSEYIIKKAKKKNCEIIERPKFLCTDNSLLSDAIYHAVDIAKKKEGMIDNFLILLCNSICFDYKSINKALQIIRRKNIDTVATISKFNMFSPIRAMKIKKKKLLNFIPNNTLKKYVNLSGDRDKSTDSFFINHSFTLSKKDVFNKPNKNPMPFQWMGKNKSFIEQEFCIGDIDFEWQIPVVEWWLKNKKLR
jgi:CMP-N-acetylneuraminic acid synthetase|tara:strand:+ start:121 stop:846 length:726 start_codon:yes stop_codon:yes gene_type:complete